MFRLAVAVSTLALIIPQVALAEWLPVDTTYDNSQISIDSESVVHKGSIVSMWKRTVLANPVNETAVLDAYIFMNCRTGAWLTSRLVGFDSDGQQIFDNPHPQKIISVPEPGSPGSTVREMVCH